MKISAFLLGVFVLVSVPISSSVSFAAQSPDSDQTDDDAPAVTQQQKPESAPQAKEKARWGINASPRYYSMYNGNNVNTFGATGGLNSPETQGFGIEVLGYLLTQGNCQLGLGLGGLGYASDNGVNTANYSQSYFGLWLGKQLQLSSVFDVQAGGLFALGVAQTSLISAGTSGRTVEQSFLIEPKLTLAFRLTPMFKMGASGSYLLPAAYTQSIRGQNLTSNAHITARGPSAGIEFIVSPP